MKNISDKSIERLLKNYFNARKSWEGWCYLNNLHLKKNTPSIRQYADKNELLFYLRYLIFKDVHIELYKIIKDNKSTSRDNIFELLRKCNSEDSDNLLIELNKFKNKLNYLTNIRDKFYAHLDKDYTNIVKSFEVENYYRTFEFIESTIIILGKEKELIKILKTIPSRDEFELIV